MAAKEVGAAFKTEDVSHSSYFFFQIYSSYIIYNS